MKIVVYDIAARKGGGGERILNQYFDIAENEPETEWWFIVSIMDCRKRELPNIHVIFVDTAKASKLKRYTYRKKYELFELKRIIERINPDELISLQNMPVPGVKCKQTVYLHQSLMFSPVKYRFTVREERSLAFRQRVICGLIRKNLCKADKVIVQTNWMKDAVIEWADYPEERIIVEAPKVVLPACTKQNNRLNNTFIYPANAYPYKNHQVILEACRILKEHGIKDYKIKFTISPDSGGLAGRLLEESNREELPIEYIGKLDREELFKYYQTMITLFPSYIETFGLPLLEAKSAEGRIIASDSPFAHEILGEYEFAEFVNWNDSKGWASAILNKLKQ